MKNIVGVFVLILSTVCFSQKKLKVEYDFFPNYFKVDNFPTFPTELLIEGQYSVFIIKSMEVESTFIEKIDNNGTIRKVLIEPSTKNSYLLKDGESGNVLDEESIYGKKFLIEDSPVFKWDIIYDTSQKTILGLKCNKASAFFRGRVYEVWFTPEIPISDGPWKFKGLPGLILSVKSHDGEITYEAVGIDTTFESNQSVYKEFLEEITSKYDEILSREEFKVKRLKILNNVSKNQKSRVSNMEADDSVSHKVNSIEKDLEFIAN